MTNQEIINKVLKELQLVAIPSVFQNILDICMNEARTDEHKRYSERLEKLRKIESNV